MAPHNHHDGHDHGSGNGGGGFVDMVKGKGVAGAALLGATADVGNLLIKAADIKSPLTEMFLRMGIATPMMTNVIGRDVLHAIEERDIPELLMHGLSGSLVAYGAAVGGKEGQEALHTGVLTTLIFRIAHGGEHGLKERFETALHELREKIPGGEHAEFDKDGKLIPIGEEHYEHLPTVMRKKRGGGGELEPVCIAALEAGDEIVVDGSELNVIPVDGTIVNINGDRATSIEVDASATTGQAQEAVHSGSRILQMTNIPTDTSITIRVDKPWGESSGIKILTGLNGTSENKAKNETALERAVDAYTIALASAGGLLLFKDSIHKGHDGKWKIDPSKTHWKKSIEDTFGFIISAAPCAVAASMLIYEAVERELHKQGTIVQSRSQLEAAEKIDAVVLDLTGTLTEGKPSVSNVEAIGGANADDLLQLAANLEFGNPHPIAQAIHARCGKGSSDIGAEHRNGGIIANGGEQAIGSISFYERNGITLDATTRARAEALEQDGYTVSIVRNGDQWGVISLEDKLRDDALDTVNALRKQGKQVYIATGENGGRVKRLATDLGFSPKEIDSPVLSERRVFHKQTIGEIVTDKATGVVRPASPKDAHTSDDITSKVELLEHLKRGEKKVMMVGDGLNDAMAMQYADVSVGMKETAVQEVQSTTGIMISDLAEVARLPKLSEKVNHAAKRNAALTGIWVSLLVGIHFMGAKIEEVFHLKIGNTVKAVLHEAATVVATAAGVGEGWLLAQEFKDNKLDDKRSSLERGWERMVQAKKDDGKDAAATIAP
ncbi:MAG: cation-translocating P-type ATPase [Alphaproteobacteria bacterium]|nr:cation-translocating P-type ATPase [Alphaproteobacteria bacterium]